MKSKLARALGISIAAVAAWLVLGQAWAQSADEAGGSEADETSVDATSGADEPGCGSHLETYLAELPEVAPDEATVAALRHMRLLEKVARDTYLALDERWGLRVFSHIARAEQHHMDHLAWLFERYELDDPIADDPPGAFSDAEAASLYTSFTTEGAESLAAALRAAARLEELDIVDLEEAIAAEPGADVAMVYQNLLKGSRNHVRGLSRAMSNQAVAYEAEQLGQERWEAIASSEHERGVIYDAAGEQLAEGGCGCAHGCGHGCGHGHGQGHGRGHGHGRGQGHGYGGSR